MARKKKEVKKEEYEIGKCHVDAWGKNSIPEGATCFELEVNYDNCYYESDMPSYIITFFKKPE